MFTNITDLFGLLNQKFSGKKTYIAAIVTILSVIVGFLSGTTTLFQALQLAIPAVLAMFLRQGIQTSVTNAIASLPAAKK